MQVTRISAPTTEDPIFIFRLVLDPLSEPTNVQFDAELEAEMQANYGAAASSRFPEYPSDDSFLKPRGGNSAILTAGLLIADVVGAGVLAMGNAVAKLGWLMAIPIICLMLAMNAHIMILVWRVQKFHPAAKSYKELACMTVQQAQPEMLGVARKVVVIGQYSFIFSTLGLYTLSIGQGLGMFFYDLHGCLPLMTLFGCALLLPINLSARFLGSFAGSVIFNCLCTLGTVMIPILWLMSQGAAVTRSVGSEFAPVSSTLSPASLVTSVSTFAFAFTGQFILVEIMSEMDDLEEFPKAYFGYSLPFQALAFLGIGLSVYYFRGSEAAGMIVNELPFGFGERLASACLVGHMLITYVIKNVVLCRGLLQEFEKNEYISSGKTWTMWYAIVMVVVAASWFLAQIVPFFSDFVTLLGATVTPVIAFIIPILLYRLCAQANDVKISGLEQCIMGAEFLVSLVLLIYGTASAVMHILKQWDYYGYPFACHCEFLWKTCSCSPTRMECAAQF